MSLYLQSMDGLEAATNALAGKPTFILAIPGAAAS